MNAGIGGVDKVHSSHSKGLTDLSNTSSTLIQNLDIALKNATWISENVLGDIKSRFESLKENSVDLSNSFKYHLVSTNTIVRINFLITGKQSRRG